jgi:hypothetical protein
VDSSIFPTEGALVDHTIYQNPPSDNDVKSYLINQLQNSPSKDLVNEITLSSISSPYGNGYYHVAIGVKDSSRTYEGTV